MLSEEEDLITTSHNVTSYASIQRYCWSAYAMLQATIHDHDKILTKSPLAVCVLYPQNMS